MTIRHLCSSSIECDLDLDDAYLYYKLLQDHLTLSDYKAVIRSNKATLAAVKSADQCWQVAVMAVVAFQKNLIEEIPAQMRGPYVFAIDTQHATTEQVQFISSEVVGRAELYFLNDYSDDYYALKMFKPN